MGCFTIEGQPSSYEESPPTSGQVPGQPVEAARPAALTYLFADIRGYTDFTAAHGADAAALLASRFIRLATDAVAAEHGRVGGTWGDEVMAQFASARDAVRAALGLQAECIRATVANGDGPMLVGVGLDVGEASSGEEEGRALALNTAARLCSRAGPGEVLTTRELVHLTGSMPGVVFDDRGRATLKGIPGRTPLVRVRPATQDRAELAKFHAVVDQLPRRRQARRRRRALVASLLVGAVLAGGASWAVSRLGPSGPPTIPGESVGVIDAGSGTLLATVTLPAGQHADALGVAGDSVWLVDSAGGTVSWIDRDTMKVRQVTGVGHTPVSAVDFAGSLWVVNQGDGTVSKISHESPQEGQPLRVGKQPTAIAAAFGSLWVVNRADNTVTRLDGHGVRQGGDIPVGDAPAGVAVSRDKVWVTNSADNTVSTIDPDDVEARTPPLAVGAGPQAVLAAAGEVFVANRLDLTVSRIDPLDRRETARPAVGDTPSGLAVAGSAVFVANSGAGTLTRLEPDGSQATTWRIGSSPVALAGDGDRLWVATRSFASAAHRGGTLTVGMSDDLFRDLDPAREYTAWTALRIVYDGLVGLRRTSRPAGLELVPDLAVALPRISQDGRTYAFTLRRGITYSDGRPLRPDDVRRGLERAFTANADPQTADGHPEYYAGIVGGRACLAKPATCSLRDGVETNPRANTVTIHLTEPDPDFLYKLSLTFATVAPPDAPMTAAGDRPLVGTGPYMIGEVTDPDGYGTSDAEHGKVTKQGLTLVRNPKFKQWSSVAQPWGYPDVIRWQPINPNDALAAVDHGDIDIFVPYVPAGDTQDEFVARLSALYGGRFHEDTTGYTFSVHMNTAVPPFDNLKARQAFTYALDRLKLADDLDLRVQTCQLVPPDYPGYRQRCPYSTSRDEAAWRGPDTETAKALSRDLGSAGRVTILSTSIFTKAEHELARTLQLLGYEPKTVELPPGKFFDVIYKPSSEPSIWIAGWAPDFPSASQYYGEFGCNLTLPAACDEKFAQLLSQANLAQRSDPAHAQTLWEDIYTRAAEQALLVPFARDTRMVIVSSRANPSFMWSWDGDLLVDQMWVR